MIAQKPKKSVLFALILAAGMGISGASMAQPYPYYPYTCPYGYYYNGYSCYPYGPYAGYPWDFGIDLDFGGWGWGHGGYGRAWHGGGWHGGGHPGGNHGGGHAGGVHH